MTDWLRLILMIFYAPMRGMREVRDRATLAPAGVLALLANTAFFIFLTGFYLGTVGDSRQLLIALWLVIQAAGLLVLIAVFFSPLTIFFANLFERRASFRLIFQQEYSALTSTLFYGFTAASLVTIFLTAVGKITGLQFRLGRSLFYWFLTQRSLHPEVSVPGVDERLITPNLFAAALSVLALLVVFGIWSMLATRVVFRLSWLRTVIVVMVSGLLLLPASRILPILSTILASPFLLIMLFLLLRGYYTEVTRTQRARESFRQNLEAATLNPADASAHYNLGLIHQQRGELDAARERFERAVQIDEEEFDAFYQLGRIARQQKRLADAIKNFEQVVTRDPAHAQHEIWREVGATYLAAGQFEDARTALADFLESRPSDPEGLYLMGRAHAGLGHKREAASLMEKCIEAVKTAPAYKYRASKRWLNEAQQFLRSQV